MVRKCHEQVAVKLQALIDKGIKVLVIPGNHDINNFWASSYLNGSTATVDHVTPDQFKTIYANMGYTGYVEMDANSLSYLYEPVDGLWVLGLDVCKYAENSVDTNVTAGAMKAATLTWVKAKVAEAKTKGKTIIAMMHHGATEHFVGQATLFGEYVIDDYTNISAELANAGLKVVFTGHFHANDITKATSGNNFIFDIETGSTVTAPSPYRIISLDMKTSMMAIATKRVTNVSYPTFANGEFVSYSKKYVHDGIRNIANVILPRDFGVPMEAMVGYKLDSIMANAMVAHYAGDEGTIKTAGDDINIQTVNKVDTTLQLGTAFAVVWIDREPADNNITISLSDGIVK